MVVVDASVLVEALLIDGPVRKRLAEAKGASRQVV